MHKVVFDCDNTMEIYGCDVDDGLTLLYLLGRDDIDILGVTTTYGNNKLEAVYENTKNMFNELNINHISLLKGALNTENRNSEAASFLVEIVNKSPNTITILATGSLTNLLGAYNLDNNFFDKVKEIVLMGGIAKLLIINNKHLPKLNFSCDSEASYKIFNSGCKVTILNAHICLQAFFGKKEYERLTKNDLSIYKYINSKTYQWFEFIINEFGIDGFYNWDIVASVYITTPELFEDNFVDIHSTVDDLKSELIINSKSPNSNINMPTLIKDVDKFNNIIFESWSNI